MLSDKEKGLDKRKLHGRPPPYPPNGATRSGLAVAERVNHPNEEIYNPPLWVCTTIPL